MKEKHTQNTNLISVINYHIVFCPRYRRKIFLLTDVKERFIALVNLKCKEMEINILEMECKDDYTYMRLNCLPHHSASDVVRALKDTTGKILISEFEELSQMKNLWTRNFFVSTNEVLSKEIIEEYVENQRKRY